MDEKGIKKTINIITIVIIAILLIGVLIFITLPKKSNIHEITYQDLVTKIENKESFILYVRQDGCSHCLEYGPVLEEVLREYDITAYSIDLTTLDDDEEAFDDLISITGTPTTVFFKDGVEQSVTTRIVGSKSKETIIERFKSQGFITN